MADIGAGAFKRVNELPIAAGHFVDRFLARNLLVTQIDKGLPEIGSANCESNEARNTGRGRQPFENFLVVFATAKNDAANRASSACFGGRDDLLAVFAAIEALDLPHVRLNSGVLQFLQWS